MERDEAIGKLKAIAALESRPPVGEALECLRELGWIRPEAALARDGDRPTVRFHINPRVASR